MIRTGQSRFLFAEMWARVYKRIQEWLFALRFNVFSKLPPRIEPGIQLETNHPVAFKSPDHLKPWGTSRDNNTNKKFVTLLHQRLQNEFPNTTRRFLDLGCSGGQLVKDFCDLGWVGIGLEGSDFSLKYRRANWATMAGTHLFTCDITKPFQLKTTAAPARFHLITMWEVLEHIHERDLPQLFGNIIKHLEPGGYFIASTSSTPDIHDGVDLHQTKWPNAQWRTMIGKNHPELEWVETGMKYYHFVRLNQDFSYLTYRKKR
jgi:SAM-dependent methyltransferase